MTAHKKNFNFFFYLIIKEIIFTILVYFFKYLKKYEKKNNLKLKIQNCAAAVAHNSYKNGVRGRWGFWDWTKNATLNRGVTIIN